MASGPEDRFVTPAMACVGDAVVVTKGAAIEATLFAATFPDRLARSIGDDVVKAADALFERMTVVPEATVAREFGLRDAGVTRCTTRPRAACWAASPRSRPHRTRLRIDRAAIPVRPEVRDVCERGMGPGARRSAGTLIATVVPGRADAFVAALADAGTSRRRSSAR